MKLNKFTIIIIALFIFLFNFILRLYFAGQIKGVSGGDAYNNLFIARYIAEGQNPFEGARRLPFYPLLLMPTQFFNIDPILYSRIISAIAGSLLSVVIFLFTLGFGLDIFLAIIAALLSGLSPSLFFVSIRPLSNSTFALLTVYSIYLFYQEYRKKTFDKNFLLWLVLGLAVMTRHEGFVVAAIIFLFLLIKAINLKNITKLLYSIIPFVLLVLPFFVNNYLNFGKLFYSDYLEYPEGLWMPKSWDEFIRNFNMISEIPKYLWFSGTQFLTYGKILSFTLLVGVFVWIYDKKKSSLPLTIILLSQVLISFWYQTTIRYWLQIIPFASFLVVYVGFFVTQKYKFKF
ncbi:MAG: phospholipid carrier-dependent glycosyltransferase, partial [Candidatus Subteraquimicrobiales bacterium]|nr:phospholipid carrier-dependent glycosyltransferase [Candidatus Subteraquimicrobiales bacterium]